MSNLREYFQKIQDLATSNSNAENQILEFSKFIDPMVQIEGFYFSPASYLAYQGQHSAVETLRTLGANVNCIAIGYARGGNHQKVEEY